jgi:16S rRNA (adenine1518-N6/adenine1519-N6)-dimethyltransferase
VTQGPNLPPLRDVIARHGLRAAKALGQHFLLDLNLTGRIARAAGDLSDGTTIEVGPGPGGLTRALLTEGAAKVYAIEKDRRCLGALQELSAAYPGRLEIIAGDALAIDTVALGRPPRRIVANLPYNVATVLLVGWLEDIYRSPGCLIGLTVMFQKEVAERLAAPPGGRAYGRLSVLSQWLCEVRTLFDVSPRAFTPPPKVTSTIVELRPRPAPAYPALFETLERTTAAAFGQRRKMLRQSLKTLGVDSGALIAAAGVPETARAEQLTVADFCALARALDAAEGEGRRDST